MKLSRVLIVGVVLASMLATGGRAAEPTKDDIAKAEARGAAVGELAVAAELASLGRGDLVAGYKSAESLVLAGGVLLRANASFAGKSEALDVQPVDAKGNPIKSEAVKAPSLKDQAEALFDEARAATGDNKSKAASIEALIKEAKTFESRGGVGGPRTITRVLNPGETHTYPVAFFSGQPAAVAMTSSGPPRIQFDITHVGGNNLFSLKGLNAGYNWTPQRDRDNVRRFTITLTNMGVRATTYTLTAN